MYQNRKLQITVILLALLLLVSIVGAYLYGGEVSPKCLGVPILSNTDWLKRAERNDADLGERILFMGKPVALDTESATIYVSQNISEDTSFRELEGNITLDGLAYDVFFLEDEMFQNLYQAMESGHAFQLIISGGREWFTAYNVIFTSLPVLRIDSSDSKQREDGKAEIYGSMCLWDPKGTDGDGYAVTSCNVQRHVRGASSAIMPKKSWKLSLKTKKWDKENETLLNLGKDDDWLLNSMSMDDTKLKDKVSMDIWNSMGQSFSWDRPMSKGAYVEAVIDGNYCGLYLVQRRVDRKYLNLGKNDILFKGKNTWIVEDVPDAYEIEYSPLTADQTYAQIASVWSGEDVSAINIQNFIDVSLFLQLGSLDDNRGFKNMFYLLEKSENGYALFYIPWDTDLGYGITWIDGFVHDPDISLTANIKRVEYEDMQEQYPDLEEQMAQRWGTLRQSVFSVESLLDVLDENESILKASGAYQREHERWGLYYDGKDSWESIEDFIVQRLEILDGLYRVK